MNTLAKNTPDIRYEMYYGRLSDEHIVALIPLRLELFYDYPYFYVGSPERELRNWKNMPSESMVSVLAYDGDCLVGAVLAYDEDAAKHPSVAQHHAYQLGKCLHLDLIMISKTHRRHGTARELLRRFEQDAITRGYTNVYGITVVRSNNHPLKPERPLDLSAIGPRLGGFTPLPLYEVWNWPTRVGVPGNEFVASIDNMVQYWHKTLVHT